ncbi:HAMP domain-containing sensor histidine kinase [Marivirga sp.]|uniref:PAS domain-containing sensor histidine kinase n=1 Tax=Marivirga sp. TaxID=2018662 RepID=UPI002D7F8CA6|nr:HAMP domain-containing sensor histidine kinase [Marivirga sp.]HET8860107.1 HAMP domain-containing sensor histidine kinase [Marivirga sp.]
MIQNYRNEFVGNQKVSLSVDSQMERSFVAFTEFFQDGKDPMFIIDLDSQIILNVNSQFVKHQSEFNQAIALFESYLHGKNDFQSRQFNHGNNVYLFNSIYQKDGKALIQILNLQRKNDFLKIDQSTPKANHFFDTLSIQKELLNNLPSGIVHTNKKFESLWFNDKFRSLFGRAIEENFNFIDAIYVKNISEFWDKIEKLKKDGGQVKFSFVIHNIKKSKEVFVNATAFSVSKNAKLQEGFIFILEDKTENMHFSEEITKQNLALNQINHELDKFLYSVSHNIRGPIASLEGLLKVIEISDVRTVNELKHHLRLNLRLLNGFVSDISNVATNIHTHVNIEEVNLRDIMEQMLLFVDNIYDFNPIVTIDIPTTYSIKTDIDRFGIIVKCLLKNSFQYKDNRKRTFEINIKATHNEDFHLIEITDNGIGISEKVKPYIFDMFYRGTELSSGNGMGLYNSREILKKIGGTMNIESKDREWTKAKIYLPVNF